MKFVSEFVGHENVAHRPQVTLTEVAENNGENIYLSEFKCEDP